LGYEPEKMSPTTPNPLRDLANRALDARRDLLEQLTAEGTDAYRLFHGVAEGLPGVTVDRYGPVVLVQSFRAPLEADKFEALQEAFAPVTDGAIWVANHRGEGGNDALAWHQPPEQASLAHTAHEGKMRFTFAARHAGKDPWLFLDFRSARRRVREAAEGKRVLNTFAYTCTAGVAAALGGARSVCNVDFARSALAVGEQNQALNNVSHVATRNVQEDYFCAVRQFARLPVKGRGRKRRAIKRYAPERFDLLVLDPPRWARSPFGAVDIVRDYPSLFKPALLSTAEGGHILATHHDPTVDTTTWTGVLRRCAEKAGRPIQDLELLKPDLDFPSFDGNSPLKLAWISV
jgi:23S rRNA (cytosine1962-C5)-methyltransferase